MDITAKMVKELRERSGVGMMECKKALVENQGDIDAAMEWLRTQGMAKADKKSSRVAAEGRIAIASDKQSAVLVEVNCETDFVAKDDNFTAFGDQAAEVALKGGIDSVDALKDATLADGTRVEDAAKGLVAKLGENIQVRRVARVASEGTLASYIHGGRIGVVVALTGGDLELAKGIAMHVAAMNPAYTTADDVPAEIVAKEKNIAQQQLTDKDKAKPPEILEKIITGKINKIVSEMTLTGQAYVLDTNNKVGQVLKEAGAEIDAIARLGVGEGIEKKEEDFQAEVMKQAGMA